MLALAALLAFAPVAEPPPPGTYQPGWDEPIAAPLEGPAPSPAAPATPPPPDPVVTEARDGRGLLIGAGVLAGVGLVANGLRAYIVTSPCQTDAQTWCTGPWALTTALAWGPNLASIAVAGVGASQLGRYHATLDRARHRSRGRVATITGSVLLGTGVLVNILLRVAWFSDWVTPGGAAMFDFSRAGHSIAYYGGLQLSSMMIASGIGSLTYGAARPRKRRLSLTPSGYGVQLSGRF